MKSTKASSLREVKLIETVFLDIDGVLTDGMVYVNSDGKESKRISFDDIDAIFKLKRSGVKIGFLTGEDNEFSEYVKRRFTPEYFISGCKDKLSAFRKLAEQEEIDTLKTCFVGDSEKDVELLKYLPFSFVPGDVDSEIKSTAKYSTAALRGNGVIREVAKFVLSNRRSCIEHIL